MISSGFDRESLKKLIEGSRLSYKQNDGSFIFDCPRCGKSEKLWIRKKDGQFICFVCAEIDGFKGRPEYALKELLNVPLAVVRAKLYGALSVQDDTQRLDLHFTHPDFQTYFPESDWTPEEEMVAPAPKAIEWPWDSFPIDDPASKRGVDYLASRGIPVRLAKAYDIRYWPSQRRVLFPVKIDGVLIGYQGRAVYPTEGVTADGQIIKGLKILTSEGMDRAHTLMFYDRLKGSKHAVLTEGPMDALKAHMCGGNVAAMGKVITKGQLNLIRCMGVEKVYLALDPDAADEAREYARELGDVELYRMTPPAGFKDLGEMSCPAVRAVFDSAESITARHLFAYFKPDARCKLDTKRGGFSAASLPPGWRRAQ